MCNHLKVTKQPKLIAFDLDDTLAPSKTRMPEEMVRVFRKLLTIVPVAVISGGNIGQFCTQLLAALEAGGAIPQELARLHLLPTCGTRYDVYQGDKWQNIYEELLTPEEREETARVLREEAQRLGLWEENTWGEIIEDRGSQITFSALGQQAPVAVKREWDPTGAKKNTLREAVQLRLPALEVRSGGSTSVDVTRKGIDKAYGMRKLAEHTGIPLTDMLFVGDRLDPAGNDYPVKKLGVPCKEVANWEETVEFLSKVTADWSAK